MPRTGDHFASQPIYYTVDENLQEVEIATGAVYQEADIVSRAVAIWNAALAKAGLATKMVPADADHKVMLTFGQGVTSELGPRSLALTSYNVWQNHVYVEPVRVRLNTEQMQGIANENQLLNTFLHEIGHVMGLDHINDPSDIMYFTDSDVVTISTKDIISVILNETLSNGTDSTNTLGIKPYA